MPRESLDAPENLAKEGPCQVTFRELYDVERRASAGGSRCRPLNQVCFQASQSLVVAFLRKGICLEPMQRGRERDARVSPLPGRERPQGRVLSKSLRVVGVLVPSQAAIDRLTKQIGQRELKVASGARIAEVSLDQRAQAEAFVEFARKQEARVGGDGGSAKLDPKLGIEREANRAQFSVTHWMMPSATARDPRNPHFARPSSDCSAVDSTLKAKMRAQKPFSRSHEF